MGAKRRSGAHPWHGAGGPRAPCFDCRISIAVETHRGFREKPLHPGKSFRVCSGARSYLPTGHVEVRWEYGPAYYDLL